VLDDVVIVHYGITVAFLMQNAELWIFKVGVILSEAKNLKRNGMTVAI
jgi:hypothetical protein